MLCSYFSEIKGEVTADLEALESHVRSWIIGAEGVLALLEEKLEESEFNGSQCRRRGNSQFM